MTLGRLDFAFALFKSRKNQAVAVTNVTFKPNPSAITNVVIELRIGHGIKLIAFSESSSQGMDHGSEPNRNKKPGTLETEPRYMCQAPM